MCLRFLLVASVAVAVVGCGESRSEGPIVLNNDRWTVGDSIWFRVAVIDSVHSTDSAYQHSLKNKAVLLTILSTSPSAHVRWQEFGLLHVDQDSASLFKQPEWIPTYQLEYACGPDGRIERLLNYPELRDLSDTLTRVYLSQVSSLTAEQSQSLYEWTMDSARLVDVLMTDAEMLHTPFGMLFSEDTVSWAEIPAMPTAYHGSRYRAERAPNPLCDPTATISFLLRTEVDSIDYGNMAREDDLLAPFMDTVMSRNEPASVFTDCCFDTLRDFPTLVEQVMRFSMKGLDLKRTTIIHLDERWTSLGL